MNKISRLAICALAFAATACSPIVDQRGHVAESGWKDQIIPGTSTKESVEQMFGSPSTVSTFGNETWYYINTQRETEAFFKPQVVKQEVVKVEFSPEGVVTAVNALDESQARKDFAYVRRTTPTEGHSLGILEQMLGNVGRFNSPAGVAGNKNRRP